MKLNESLVMEIREEAKGSRKMLERVPEKSFAWKPHQKSMTLGRLASHVAELPGWVTTTLECDELDFGKFKYTPPVVNTPADLLKILEVNVEKAVASLNKSALEDFSKMWTMRNNETVYFTMPKIVVIREFAMNHLYHHRGQLSVYLRMLDVPLPGVYGPTADELMM